MVNERTYETQRACPVARTLDVLGGRWTMLILRDLSFGRQKFSALQESLKGISANLLSDRLKTLEESGMIEQVAYSAHPPRFEYKLTAKGHAFVPVLVAMRAYGETWEPEQRHTAKQV
ncbi:MAG: helix-turn-helix domain-containing protein [Tepidiformaceae bacterium]